MRKKLSTFGQELERAVHRTPHNRRKDEANTPEKKI
jgi:hypothetical protein